MHGVTVELLSYQLKDVANQWYKKWEDLSGVDVPPAVWEKFLEELLNHFFLQELRKAKVEEYINMK